MAGIKIDKELCKGCGLCVNACPRHLIELSKNNMNKSGYFIAEFGDSSKCIGCTLCAVMCPDCVITVEK